MPPRKKKNSSLITFLFFIIFVIIVSLTVVLIAPVYSNYQQMERRLQELEKELEEKNAECMSLSRQVNDLQSNPKAVEKVAREKFGLGRKGETIYKYDKSLIPKKDEE